MKKLTCTIPNHIVDIVMSQYTTYNMSCAFQDIFTKAINLFVKDQKEDSTIFIVDSSPKTLITCYITDETRQLVTIIKDYLYNVLHIDEVVSTNTIVVECLKYYINTMQLKVNTNSKPKQQYTKCKYLTIREVVDLTKLSYTKIRYDIDCGVLRAFRAYECKNLLEGERFIRSNSWLIKPEDVKLTYGIGVFINCP